GRAGARPAHAAPGWGDAAASAGAGPWSSVTAGSPAPNISTRPPPAPLARASAVSALRHMSAGALPPASAAPTLAVMLRSESPIRNGSAATPPATRSAISASPAATALPLGQHRDPTAPPPRARAPRRYRHPGPPGDLGEQQIACGLPAHVVPRGEAVDVHDDDPRRPPLGRRRPGRPGRRSRPASP